jgi:lipoprotein-releasing system permease protein
MADMNEPTATRPFSPYEWLLSLRYLRARRKEGFISVTAGFSFLGFMLGVAVLIIVMAVMNGFRTELLSKILGLNGHLLVQPVETPLALNGDEASACPSTIGAARMIPSIPVSRCATASQSVNGVSIGCTNR